MPSDFPAARDLYKQDLRALTPAEFASLDSRIQQWFNAGGADIAPDGFVWNHDVLTGELELMPSAIHSTSVGGFAHTGGVKSYGDDRGVANLQVVPGSAVDGFGG